MHSTIPKQKEGGIVRKCWIKARAKPSGQTPNSASPVGYQTVPQKGCQFLSSLLTSTYFFHLAWFHSLLSVLFGEYPMVLTYQILEVSKGIQALFSPLHEKASSGLHGPFWHMPDLRGFFSHQGRFHNVFLPSLTLKPISRGQNCQVLLLCLFLCLFLWLEHEPLNQLYLHQLSVFNGFLHSLNLALMELALLTRMASNSELY